ncbi:MAG TPA: hypothetical protein VIU14_07790 [Mesorhizobium sp.]|jgi:hypothetical protein
MAITKRWISLAGLAAFTALAAGCTTSGPSGPSANAPKPTAFDGAWVSADGIAESRFAGGVFSTTATENGTRLADGSYVLADQRTANITVKSLIRGTTSNVTCLLATETQLNCTSSSGQTFILNRKPVGAA